MKRFAITALAALGILAGTVPAARAADATCPPNPATGATINGNLVVPAGNTCQLQNVTVTGNVQVGKGASLLVEPVTGQTVTIGGNVQATHCQFVQLLPSGTVSVGGGTISVGGNVQIRNCTGLSGYNAHPSAVPGAQITISGNFACDHNSAGCSAIQGSVRGNVQVNNNSNRSGPGADVELTVVGGNVQVNKNNSGSFASLVAVNTIGGNLQCAGNTPGVLGGGNTVTGNKLGQCAGF
jgi:hypothetical protein